VAIRRRILPKDHPDIADSLNNLGIVQRALRDYEGARQSHEEALAIRRRVLPKDHPDIAQSLHYLGTVQWQLRDYEAAHQCLREALAISRNSLPKNHPNIAANLNNLGIVQRALRDYAGARQSHEEALAIRRKALPKDHPDIASNLTSLGVVQRAQRDYAAARKSHEEALAIYRKALPKDHPLIAQCLNNLGTVQWQLRDYEGARKSHEEALAIQRQSLPQDHPHIALSLHNLGNVQYDLGQGQAARQSYQKALAIFRQTLPKDHPDIADTLNSLGNVQWQLSDYAGARKSHQAALAIYRKSLPKDDPHIATSLNNLGLVQAELQDYEAARKSCEEALAIRRKALPNDHPDIAVSLGVLGGVQARLGDVAGARKNLEESLAICRQSLPQDHPLIVQNLLLLGLVQVGLGDSAGARSRLAEAIHIFQRGLSRLALAQAEAEQFRTATQTAKALDPLLSLAEPHNPRHVQQVYAALVAVKGAVTARQRWARHGRDAANPEMADLLHQLRQANAALLSLASPTQTVAPDHQPRDIAAEIRSVSERRARLEQQLAAANPAYRRFLEQGRRTPADVRAALPPGTALQDCIDYWHFSAAALAKGEQPAGRRMAIFVVRPDRGDVAIVPLGGTDHLAQLVERWRDSYGRGKTPPAGEPDPAVQLRKELWEPLEQHLAGVKVVLVSPDGPLNGLPLAALPGKEPGTFLVHQYAFAVVPVPQLLPDLLEDKPAAPDKQQSLLLAGGIAFGDGPPAADPSARLPPLPRFADLPGTESEVNDLRAQFEDAFPAAPAPTLLRKARATKAAFLAAAPKACYVHLATHGFFADEKEKSALDVAERARLLRGGIGLREEVSGRHPGLLSGVVFAGVNEPGRQPEDTVLTALEAAELDFSGAQLVTLSACETGRGAVAGGEGVLGLQRALQISGARSVLASLWKVSDAETHQLMREFYKRLWSERPLARAEALRQAQLWMLEHARPRGLVRIDAARGGPLPPYYWAAFVLSGDWR
jgi:CHAT domain-containing protein/Tfp pilus assembly protein PilF